MVTYCMTRTFRFRRGVGYHLNGNSASGIKISISTGKHTGLYWAIFGQTFCVQRTDFGAPSWRSYPLLSYLVGRGSALTAIEMIYSWRFTCYYEKWRRGVCGGFWAAFYFIDKGAVFDLERCAIRVWGNPFFSFSKISTPVRPHFVNILFSRELQCTSW